MNHSVLPPDLALYSDAPRYNIQAVEKATGLSPRTLRSWERRYGVPVPLRDESRRRLYSERDIALIRWLMERVEQGMSIGRAVAMLKEERVEGGIAASPRDLEHLQLRLLQAIDWMDEDEVRRVLAAALSGASAEDVALNLIVPVLHRVGDLWATGRMSVASEHFGTHILRTALADLFQQSPHPWRPFHIFVGSAPGELHDVGALVLALFLRRAGFRVTYLGASIDGESLLADLQRIRPHAVLLSASMESTAQALASLYAAIHQNYNGILIYGGSAFDEGNGGHIPGTNLDGDVQQAVDVLLAALEGETAGA